MTKKLLSALAVGLHAMSAELHALFSGAVVATLIETTDQAGVWHAFTAVIVAPAVIAFCGGFFGELAKETAPSK